MRVFIRRILTVLSALLLVVVIGLLVELFGFHRERDAAAQQQAEQTSAEFRDTFSGLLLRVSSEGQATAGRVMDGLRTDTLREAPLTDILRETSLKVPESFGVTTCFEPFAYSADIRLYCPYYDKKTSNIIQIGEAYDYSVPSPRSQWYVGIRDNGAGWTRPIYGQATQNWFVGYGVPLLARDGGVLGIIEYSIAVSNFQTIVHDLASGKAALSYIASEDGTFVSHPVSDFVGTTTIDDRLSDPGIGVTERTVLEAMLTGEATTLDYTDPEKGGALAFTDTLDGSGFRIGTAYYRSELFTDHRAVDRRYILISLALSFSLIIAALRWFSRDRLEAKEIDGLSYATTAVLLANVLFIGHLQHTQPTLHDPGESPPIVDSSTLGSFIGAETARAQTLKLDTPIGIPTGIFIEGMEFADSYNVNMSGKIWQRYPVGLVDSEGGDDVVVGIHFPQISPFAESSYIEEVSREPGVTLEGEDDYTLVTFDFRVTLRLNLSYSDFPFDKRHLDIQLAPASYFDSLILVPDLDGYTSTSPSRLSGIDTRIKLPGSEIVETYFNFTAEEFDTNFGVGTGGTSAHLPTLHFNIHQKRYLINAFVTYLIPIGVTLALIYILILSCEKTETRQGIIESMAAFIFVLIFSHIDLRKNIETAELMFMEYFYFITYLMVILSTFNLISYTRSRVGYFDYNDNQLFRAAYFPVFFTLLLLVMMIRFY